MKGAACLHRTAFHEVQREADRWSRDAEEGKESRSREHVSSFTALASYILARFPAH